MGLFCPNYMSFEANIVYLFTHLYSNALDLLKSRNNRHELNRLWSVPYAFSWLACRHGKGWLYCFYTPALPKVLKHRRNMQKYFKNTCVGFPIFPCVFETLGSKLKEVRLRFTAFNSHSMLFASADSYLIFRTGRNSPWNQGRIYVANEYPTFARTMSMVGQKLTFLCQITLNVRENLSVLMKNMQILG